MTVACPHKPVHPDRGIRKDAAGVRAEQRGQNPAYKPADRSVREPPPSAKMAVRICRSAGRSPPRKRGRKVRASQGAVMDNVHPR